MKKGISCMICALLLVGCMAGQDAAVPEANPAAETESKS